MKWSILKRNLLLWVMQDDVNDFHSSFSLKLTSIFDLVRMPPRLDTIENTMKLSQMMVQALWNNKSPLLQLPHIAEGHLRFFETKKVNKQSSNYNQNSFVFLFFSIQLNLFDNLLQWIMKHVDQCYVVLPMNSTTISWMFLLFIHM